MVAATPSWWLPGVLMPFAGAVVACPSLGTPGTYCSASRRASVLCRCRTRRFFGGPRVPGRIRGSGWCPVRSARRPILGTAWGIWRRRWTVGRLQYQPCRGWPSWRWCGSESCRCTDRPYWRRHGCCPSVLTRRSLSSVAQPRGACHGLTACCNRPPGALARWPWPCSNRRTRNRTCSGRVRSKRR